MSSKPSLSGYKEVNKLDDAVLDSASRRSSASSNLVPSPYQKAGDDALSSSTDGRKDELSNVVILANDDKNINLHRRQQRRSTKRSSPNGGAGKNLFKKSFSLDLFNFSHSSSDEEDEEFDVLEESHHHVNDYRRFRRKRRLILVAVFLVCSVVLVVGIRKNKKYLPSGSSAISDGNIRQSCGEFFEPDPIMALKSSSTVENMQYGAVAADNKICSDVGVQILRDHNGSAVDAAVATALCLGVVNPASSGIGGGAFILVHADMASHTERIGNERYVPPPFDDQREYKKGAKSSMTSTVVVNAEKDALNAEVGTKKKLKVTEFIDCREKAPTAAYYDMFESLPPTASVDGGLAIAVPGELRGLELAHSRHGALPWSTVVEPAMKLAQDGFRVPQHLAHDIAINAEKIFQFENLARILSKNNDGKTLLTEGDVFKRPDLAETLRAIMKDGADAIYKGERAAQLAKDIQSAGGLTTEEDISSYRPALRTPLVAHDVNGFTMVGAPPPSSGGAAVIGAARFLAGYASPLASFADTLSMHRIVEACKHVFAIRMSLSDPAFNTNVTLSAVADMIKGDYMEKLRRSSSDYGVLGMSQYGGEKWAQLSDGVGQGTGKDAQEGDRRRTVAVPGDFWNSDKTSTGRKIGSQRQFHRRNRLFGYLEDHGTTHLSVIDKERNAVAITSTVNTYFGSGVASPSTGIIFNNQMDDFATPGRPNFFGLAPSEANYIAAYKRPLSSMSPTFIFRGRNESATDADLGNIFLAIGASGGPKIITAVLHVFINYAMSGMPLFESVANPRVHDQLLYHGAAVTTTEQSPLLQGPTIETIPRTKTALVSRKHRLLPVDYMGTVQAVAVDLETNRLAAVSDIRKGGSPAGY